MSYVAAADRQSNKHKDDAGSPGPGRGLRKPENARHVRKESIYPGKSTEDGKHLNKKERKSSTERESTKEVLDIQMGT